MPASIEIRLYADASKTVHVECPQSLLVRLQHFLGTKGFQCGVARISTVTADGTRGKVAFEIGKSSQEDVKFAVRVFLAASKLKFVEKASGAQTVFHLTGKDFLRSRK